MRRNNPAVYECPKDKQNLHTWVRNKDGTAKCRKCGLKLTVEQSNDVWRE